MDKEEFEEESTCECHCKASYIGRGLASIGAAIACAAEIQATHGETGIGWFIIALIVIW